MANGQTQAGGVTAAQAQAQQQKAQQDYYHQMAQQYGMTDDQFKQVVGPQAAGQAVPNYGQPTSYFTPERQMSPSGKWTDISPQQNANFASLQQLNQVGLLGGPQVQQPPAGQTLADLWNAFKAQGRQQTQQPPQQQQSAITPTTPYQGQALTQGTPFATIPTSAPAAPTGTYYQPSIQQTDPQQFVRGYASGGFVTDPSRPRPLGQQDSQQTGQSGQYATSPVGLPQNAMTELGTRALGAVGFPMQAIYNRTPQPATQGPTGQGSQSPYGGGVYTGSLQPTVSAGVLGGPGGLSWDDLASTNNLGADDIAELKKTGLTPDQLTQGSHFGLNLQQPGGTPTVPGVFSSAPRLAPSGTFNSGGGSTGGGGATGGGWAAAGITPTTPANAAGAGGGTPWATAPPAPTSAGMGGGVSPALMQAHNTALENAGKTLYAHFGGDPDTATPAHIADFHHQLTQLTGAITGAVALSGAPRGGAPVTAATNYTAGANQPVKANSGGLVPGRGNTDSVLALLTPGEYVIPKEQVTRMQSGGLVQDPNDNQPPELSRMRLVVPSPSQPPTTPDGQAQPSQPQGPQQQPGGGSAAAPGQSPFAALAARQALNSGGASGGGYNTPGGYIGASPGPGQSGYMYPSQGAATAAGDVGTGVQGAGGGNIGGAISGLASGLAAAAKTYADSVKPFTVHEAKMSYVGQEPTPQLAQNQAQAPPNADYYRNYFPSMS